MFTNIMQPNMNGVGGTPFALNIQVNNVNGQNGFDTDSFIKILTAIVSGFNDTVMNLEGGLFAGKDSPQITVDDVSNGLFVGNDGNVVAGETFLQLIGFPQPIIALNQDNQKITEATTNLTSHIHGNVNGNTIDNALVNFITNTNSNGNVFLQIKAMADTVNGQEFQKASSVESQESSDMRKASNVEYQSKIELITPNTQRSTHDANIGSDQHMHIKTALSEKEIEPAVNISDAKTHLVVNEKEGGMIASASQLYNAPYVKNDSAIVVNEPIHVNRLHELGEVMEKTVRAGDKHLIIKIEPPDLGSIQIKLRMDNGMLSADLKVDSPVVKDLFSMAIPQIKTSLEDSGIKVSDFFVDVKEDYYSDGRRQQEDTNQQQHKQDKESKFQFFDFFA